MFDTKGCSATILVKSKNFFPAFANLALEFHILNFESTSGALYVHLKVMSQHLLCILQLIFWGHLPSWFFPSLL